MALARCLQKAQPRNRLQPLKILNAKASNDAKKIIHHSLNGYFSIREGNWKYIDAMGHCGFAQIKEEVPQDSVPLYNMENAPAETTHVFEKNQEVVQELKILLKNIRNRGSAGQNSVL